MKIERELQTTYIVKAKKAETLAKTSKTLVAKLPRLADAWERKLTYYDSLAKPGDTGGEVPA